MATKMSAMSLRLKNLQILAAVARECLWLEVIVEREGGSSCHLVQWVGEDPSEHCGSQSGLRLLLVVNRGLIR